MITPVLEALYLAGVRRDSAEVLVRLRAVLESDERDGVLDALYAHRTDLDAAFILGHLKWERTAKGWKCELKGGVA